MVLFSGDGAGVADDEGEERRERRWPNNITINKLLTSTFIISYLEIRKPTTT